MGLQFATLQRFFFVCSFVAWICTVLSPTTQGQAPRIDKIDPPGWWVGLPDPMLLAHGEHLQGSRFSVSGIGVQLARTQTSENGHWAFLWLRAKSAKAQTITLSARNSQGLARRAFVLSARSTDAHAHLGFSSADAMYLIMTDRFARGRAAKDQPGLERDKPRGWHGGDFAGIAQHLDYLQQLGVTTVWTTPVASNGAMPDSYHGYAATDLYAVDPHFGTLEDYRRLSGALHARHMKLVTDLVPNHLGVQHPWVHDPPAPNWFHGTLEHHIGAQYDFAQLVDPHAPRQAWRAITTGWFTDAMPDLNQENPLVATYLIQNALWWVETANLDGIRLDTFPYVSRAFWHDFHASLHAAYPHLTTVGEVFNGDPEITSFFAGGILRRGIDTGLDTPFDFPVYFALGNALISGKPMTELAGILRRDSLYPHPERLVTFIGNHDTMRLFTAAHESVPKLKLALGLIATLRGMPQFYSGDEIAMAGGDDPDNRRDFPGGFPGDAHNAFTASGRTPVEQEVFAWTSALLTLRKTQSVMQTGLEQNLISTDDVFAFVRASNETGCSPDHSRERVLIVVNKGRQNQTVELSTEDTALAECTDFDSMTPALGSAPQLESGKLRINQGAESMSLYRVR
jgi:glycosidase